MEKLELKDFDLLGIINLQDAYGIESLVTPVMSSGKTISYLSRSKEYYNVKSMKELSQMREKLKELLTERVSKKNFVILEYMLNCSARVYFKKFEEYIKNGKSGNYRIELQQAEKCLMEDTASMISVLEGRKIDKRFITNILPTGDENCERRFIEMDNKAILYLFAKGIQKLNIGNNFEVLTPGYGSMYIGPFLKVKCGYDYSNMMKSKYIDETNGVISQSLTDLLSNDKILSSSVGILLLDDNIGTGSTMVDVKQKLKKIGKDNILSGAVQYNWRNYYRVSIGEKTDIERFEVDDYDFLTPFNYAGHKLYEHAVNALNSGGTEYIEYLNSKGYRMNDKYSDIVGDLLRGLTWAGKANLELISLKERQDYNNAELCEVVSKYKHGPFRVNNSNARQMVRFMYESLRELLDKDIDDKEYIDKN